MALRDEVLTHYPQYAWALSNPEVTGVLEQAVANQWDASRLVQGLQETEWWKKTTPSARQYQQRMETDPAQNEERERQTMARLWDFAQKNGLNLSSAVIEEQARIGEQLGLTDQQLTDALVERTRANGYQGVQAGLGTISTSMAALKQQAKTYMVDVDDTTAFQWATQIANGEKQVTDFTPLIQDWAKARFSYDENLVKQIDGGFTPEQLFAPQRTAMAKLLEVGAESIDLTDPKWNQVIDYADPSSGKRRAMTTSETEKLVRGTTEWRKTLNGQQVGADMAGRIRQMMTGSR